MLRPLMRSTLAGLAVALVCAPGPAHAEGLLVLKGNNPSPEFARVIPITKCEKFTVNYRVQVPGKGETIFTIDQIFDVVEYPPEILTRDLIQAADFEPISEVIAKAKALANTYPAMKAAVPGFIKPLEEVIAQRDRGLVQFRGEWIRKAAYEQVLADEKRMADEKKRKVDMEDAARMAEQKRKEDQEKAMAEALVKKLEAEEKARKDAEAAKAAAAMRADEERKREAAEMAENLRKQKELNDKLDENLISVSAHPTGKLLRAEWDRLAAAQRPDGSTFPGFKGEGAMLAALTGEHFPADKKSLPTSFGPDVPATYQTSPDTRNLLVLLSGPQGHTGCLMTFDLPVDEHGMLASGTEPQRLMTVLRDVSSPLADELPRALSVCLTSLAKSGELSVRAPIGEKDDVSGYLALARPRLESDGSHRATVLVVLGFKDEKQLANP